MNIELSEKELRRLLEMVYIGNWILNSTRGDDRFEDYDLLPEKEDGGIHEAIADYEDAVFYNILAEELARRDLGLENSDPEDFSQLQERMEEYMEEFDKNGLNTINIDI